MIAVNTILLQVLSVPTGCTAVFCAIEAATGKTALNRSEGRSALAEIVDGDPSIDIPALEAAGFKVGLIPF